MAQIYTDKLLLKLIYGELDLFTKLEMEFAMDEDSTLLKQYNQLKSGYDTLPKVTFSPKKSVIQQLLDYANTPDA
ncbi:MAG TPA: hypothetical protein PK611_02835 [Saprospiraceae bacterium]|jgi:hypothetical protein|nr:hypothetical protein [Saprospiraceae bacterium]HRO08842.1 hypothetical protein [Saprospiraceae bacterium]HRO72584.1 hypothetical protein [Saprospiraceae bacterium]HRP42068.1 hypothetical protein [Saprospiraceae bacterium]